VRDIFHNLDPMQDSTRTPREGRLSKKLDRVWERIRRVPHSIRRLPRHDGPGVTEALPSSFRHSYTSPSETDQSGSALSIATRTANDDISHAATFQPRTPPSPTMDGVGESWRHNGQQSSALQSSPRPVAAIFVHAGAGYHSTTNEHTHLRACRE
jgi:taspase (threonine aspartase 1)